MPILKHKTVDAPKRRVAIAALANAALVLAGMFTAPGKLAARESRPSQPPLEVSESLSGNYLAALVAGAYEVFIIVNRVATLRCLGGNLSVLET